MINDGQTQVNYFQYVSLTPSVQTEIAQSGAPMNGSSTNAELVSSIRPQNTYYFSDIAIMSNPNGTYEYAAATDLATVCGLGENQNTVYPDYSVSMPSSLNGHFRNGSPGESNESRLESGTKGINVYAGFQGNVLSGLSSPAGTQALEALFYSDQQCTFGNHEYGFGKDVATVTVANYPGTLTFYYSDHANCIQGDCNSSDSLANERTVKYSITNLAYNSQSWITYNFVAYLVPDAAAPNGYIFRVQVWNPSPYGLVTCTVSAATGEVDESTGHSYGSYDYMDTTTTPTLPTGPCTFDVTPPSWFRADLLYGGNGYFFAGIEAVANPDAVGNTPSLFVGSFTVGK